MYGVNTYTKMFDVEKQRDMQEYSALVDDPLCVIIREIKEKITEKSMNEEGNPEYIKERIVLVVTYQQQRILG